MVISTEQAKAAATPEVTRELHKLVETLLKIPDRDEQHKSLRKLRMSVSPATSFFLDITALREKEHRLFMNHILPKVEEYQPIRGPHDCSKDELFFFFSAAHFDGGVKSDALKSHVFGAELVRHYTHEPHHPEWEKYNEGECQNVDILEMAIDRLARNVQFGDGTIHMDVMKKFIPNFVKGDNEAKQALLLKYVQKYSDFVEEEFLKMFPEARNWPKEQTTSS